MKRFRIISLWLAMVIFFTACGFELDLPVGSDFKVTTYKDYSGLLIKYIDVEQGDSELIMLPDKKTLLIDGGDVGTSDELVEFIKDEGIEKIDYMVATHPHADHIGGLDDVLNSFPVGEFLMPYIPEKDVPTTKVYENLLDAALNNGCEVIRAKAGITICEGEDYKAVCLSPVKEENDGLNNYSAVVKLTYKDTSYLFMGDAEFDAEFDILETDTDISADVIKIGHHGSYTATGQDFLKSVNPQYAVISVGEGNKYGHPHDVTISKLNAKCKVYRTDQMGSVTLQSDGTNIHFAYQKSIYS